jgi:hypothetical protein
MKDLVVEKVMSIAQRRKRAQQLRRIEPKLVRQRAIKRKRLADENVIYARAQKLARKMFRIKFAGQQGAHYQSLSPTQKIQIDKLIDEKGKAIKRLAMRLVPVVRMAEYKRFQALKGKHGEPTVPHLQNEEKVHNNNGDHVGDIMKISGTHAKIPTRTVTKYRAERKADGETLITTNKKTAIDFLINEQTEQLDEISRLELLRRKAQSERNIHKRKRGQYSRQQRFASPEAEARTAWRNVRKSKKHLKGFDAADADNWTIAQMIRGVSGKSAKKSVRRGRTATGPESITGADTQVGYRNKLMTDEVEILTFAEVILEDDMSKFNKLMAVGLVDKNKYLQYKKAMSDIRKNSKIAAYREMIMDVLDELMDVVTKDSSIYQRVKMAVEKND